MYLNNYSVYVLTFPNNKHYVGATRQKPERRWRNGKGYGKHTRIGKAIDEFGWENVHHIVVYNGLTKEEAGDKERELIQVLKSNDNDYGYNIANGGFTGDTVSKETRNKISKSRKGLVFTDEHIRNLSISHKNKHPTKEQSYKNMINSPRRKPVLCVDNGVVYPSARDAGRKTGFNHRRIAEACNGKFKNNIVYGLKWRWSL